MYYSNESIFHAQTAYILSIILILNIIIRRFLFAALLLSLSISSSKSEYNHIYYYTEKDLFNDAVEFIINHEGWHGKDHHPFVGYGHKLTKKDRFNHNISRSFARELVIKDLKQKCSVFKEFGKDSLLLGILAYNVGEGNVIRSEMVKKIRSGNRSIYKNYVSFCKANGKIVPSIKNRRIKEYNKFFNKTKITRNGFKSKRCSSH